MEIDLENQTVAQIVGAHYRTAEVFRRYGIDFCCGGQAKVADVCRRKGIDLAQLQAELEDVLEQPLAPQEDFASWSPKLLIDYIEERHHTYVRQKLPLLLQYSKKVAKVHGHGHPEVIALAKWISALADELEAHLEKEERELFPYVRQLVQAYREGQASPAVSSDHLEHPLAAMRAEHEHAGSLMQKMRQLTDGFTPPEYACNTWRVLYQLLEEFERDLHQHVHLENNLLFPKAASLAQALV